MKKETHDGVSNEASVNLKTKQMFSPQNVDEINTKSEIIAAVEKLHYDDQIRFITEMLVCLMIFIKT